LKKLEKKAKKDLIESKKNGKRSWIVNEEDKKKFKKGKFSDEELVEIKKAICGYV